HALDRRDIHRRHAPELVLRRRAYLTKLGQRRPLRRRGLGAHARGEQRRVALAYLPEDETHLAVEHVVGADPLRPVGRRVREALVGKAHEGSRLPGLFQRKPSSPLMSYASSPPRRGSGRPPVVTATATTISLARGASLMLTCMPSKCERT